MSDFICLFFDADGIVRATDTIAADDVMAAIERAKEMLAVMSSLDTFELWQNGRRVHFGRRGEGNGRNVHA